MVRDGLLHARGHVRRVGTGAAEHHVPALEIGLHVAVAEADHQPAQILHLDPLGTADVDAAKQRHVLRRQDSLLPFATSPTHSTDNTARR
jgi:hypothetical protein